MFLCSWVFLGIAGKSYRWQYISCSSIFETILNGLTSLRYTGVSHFLRQIKVICKGPKIISVFAITTVGNFPSRFFSVQVDLFHSMHSKDIKLLPCCWLEETYMGCTFEFSWILLFFLCFFFSFTFFRTFVSLCVFSSSFSSSLFFASLATATDFFIGVCLSNLSELLTIEPQGFIFLCVWLFDVNVCFALSNFF